MIVQELEMILNARARRMAVEVKVVDGDMEEGPVVMVLSVNNRDIELLNDN